MAGLLLSEQAHMNRKIAAVIGIAVAAIAVWFFAAARRRGRPATAGAGIRGPGARSVVWTAQARHAQRPERARRRDALRARR